MALYTLCTEVLYMKTVLVLFGGRSSEYEISLVSGASVIRHIPKDKYDIITIGITKDGKWLLCDADADKIEHDKWQTGALEAVISSDFGSGEIIVSDGRRLHADVCFPVLHGKNGEDGAAAALLTVAGMPYVGCDAISGAMCMDKAVTNTIADCEGIPQAKWLKIRALDYESSADEFLDECADRLGYPMFVKPANTGSSVGVSKAADRSELDCAIKKAFEFDKKVVIEECIVGHEVECAVLGNDEPVASVVGEINPANEFYDYDAKYSNASSKLLIPAPLDGETSDGIRALAVKIYKALGCSGLSRVDFFVRYEDGGIRFNEINTMPGFTPISMYPKLFAAEGIEYPELLDKLITLAFERGI